jgi:hypothetical protein
MADRDRHMLGCTDNIGKLEPDKANIVAFNDLINAFELFG